MNPNNSTYIERGGDMVAQHPFMLEKAHMRCFFLDADANKLQALCDRLFNEPTNNAFEFRPLSNTVILAFAQIERAYSAYQPQLGSMPEIDVAFWLPLLSQRDGKLHLSWYMAYVFVDNPFAMASGREIYGFPKTTAQFQIPDNVDSGQSHWIQTLAMERFGVEERIRPLRLFEVNRQASSAEKQKDIRPREMVRHVFANLMGGQETFSTRLQLGWRYFRNLAEKQHTPMVFLRQLRDIQDPTCAAYQEIIEAPAVVKRYHRGGFLPGSYEVNFMPNASFPIVEELGLCASSNPVRAAFWVEFDFLMDVGRPLWRSK